MTNQQQGNEPKTNPLNFPALRRLGELADHAPVIVVDSRELTPLSFSRLQSEVGTLVSGDYSICGLEHLFAIERKSIADLIGCCTGENRQRFERELHRLRGFQFKRLVVVGTEREIVLGQYRSEIKPKSVISTLRCFECRYDIPVVFCDTPAIAAERIESWAFWYAREYVQIVNGLWRGVQPTNDHTR
jgi:ERCC4-type nuclease